VVTHRFLERELEYTGAQLRSSWVGEMTGLAGDAAAAFIGPCDVKPEHMVDRVDLEAGARIYSPRMLHIILEHPGLGLDAITLCQRLLMAIAGEIINAHLGDALICRDGDDLYLRDRKLSISVATTSPTSGLIHSGFNVRGEGAPVPAIGLEELALQPRRFAEQLLSAYAKEIESAKEAAEKVKRVG
jgi:hypothetical protein